MSDFPVISSFDRYFKFSYFLCQARNWLVKRSYEDFRVLDKHLHLCIYDRRYSQLAELPRYNTLKDTVEVSYSRINVAGHG